MTHQELLERTNALLVDAADGDASMTGYGLGRVLECIRQVCENTTDDMAKDALPGLNATLHALETSGGFTIVDCEVK